MRSGRFRGPGKRSKKVGGVAPHICEGFPGPPGPRGRPDLKNAPPKSGQTASRPQRKHLTPPDLGRKRHKTHDVLKKMASGPCPGTPGGMGGPRTNLKIVLSTTLSDSLEGVISEILNCHEIVLELVCGADFWCNLHGRTSPVVLERFGGQVWPKIDRKTEKTEYRIANEPLS